MNEITLIVLFKGIGMLAAIIGGIYIARCGFHLYKDGVGSNDDHAAFEVGPIKIKSKSVGSVVMATAFLWAYAGVLLSPNLDKSGNDIKVYSFNTHDLSLSSIALEAQTTNSEIQNNPEELKALFSKTLSNATDFKKAISLNGQPANIQANSVTTFRSETGKLFLATKVSAVGKTATLAYEPQLKNGAVVFQPAGFGINFDNN